jgi:glycosyltransferase involved in cell wall biosynthesis
VGHTHRGETGTYDAGQALRLPLPIQQQPLKILNFACIGKIEFICCYSTGSRSHMTTNPIISVVIPCLNEEEILADILAELSATLKDYAHEIIIVDDGSTDRSVAIMKDNMIQYPAFKPIFFTKNYGQQAAIYAGLKHAAGACMLVMDADMHDLFYLMPEMINKWQKGARGVFTFNKDVEQSSEFKIETASLFYKIYNLFSRPAVKEGILSFMLIDSHIAKRYTSLQHNHYMVKIALFSLTENPVLIPTLNPKRPAGVTKYPLLKMLRLALTTLIVLWKVPFLAAWILKSKTRYTLQPTT